MYEQPKIDTAHRPSPAHAHGRAHLTGTPLRKAADPRTERLVGHLTALRVATEAVRLAAEDTAEQSELDAALAQLSDRVATISADPAGAVPVRATVVAGSDTSAPRMSRIELHDHAHTLAGRLLLVAAAQQDTATAMLACRRMDSHAAALRQPS